MACPTTLPPSRKLNPNEIIFLLTALKYKKQHKPPCLISNHNQAPKKATPYFFERVAFGPCTNLAQSNTQQKSWITNLHNIRAMKRKKNR